jgi:mycothiol synthase
VPELVVPTVEDAGRIAQLINERAVALGGAWVESAAGVARWFALPVLDPARDMRLAVDADGTAGYADVSGPEDDTPEAWVDLRALSGRPEAMKLLFAWAQERAAEKAGPGGRLRFFADERDSDFRASLESAGFTIIRSSYEMERSLDGELDLPIWPEGIVVRPFDERDARAVYAAHDEAFADHWGYTPVSFEAWSSQNLVEDEEGDFSLWRIAWDGSDVAGVCINRPRHGDDDSMGWIGVLGVRRPWRRQGLGESLLRESFLEFRERGKRAAGLGVDAENTTGAVALYERVGLSVVRRSDTWERIA